jgi:hypothetical protein
MNINKVRFSKKIGHTPKTIVVEMTVAEAAFIAKFTGKQNVHMANAVMPDGHEQSSEIYDCLVGEFFNRYWDEGVDGAIK